MAIYIGLWDSVGGALFCLCDDPVPYYCASWYHCYQEYSLAVMQALIQPKRNRYWRSSTIESMATLLRRWMLWTMESQPLMELQGGCVRMCANILRIYTWGLSLGAMISFNKYVWCHNYGIMWLICTSYQRKSKQYIISLAAYQLLVQFASLEPRLTFSSAHVAVRTLNLLFHRQHPSMLVNSSSPLQWWHSCSAWTLNPSPDYDKEQTSDLVSHFAPGSVARGLLSRPLETRSTLRHSFENASLWPPLFVHIALQFWPIVGLLNL